MNLRFPGKIGDCRSITLLDVIRNIDNIARTFLQEYIKKYMTSCKIYGISRNFHINLNVLQNTFDWK